MYIYIYIYTLPYTLKVHDFTWCSYHVEVLMSTYTAFQKVELRVNESPSPNSYLNIYGSFKYRWRYCQKPQVSPKIKVGWFSVFGALMLCVASWQNIFQNESCARSIICCWMLQSMFASHIWLWTPSCDCLNIPIWWQGIMPKFCHTQFHCSWVKYANSSHVEGFND